MTAMRYVLVKLRRGAGLVHVDGRTITKHALFGNVHALPLADALRLIDDGRAKLPKHLSIGRLRDEVAALA